MVSGECHLIQHVVQSTSIHRMSFAQTERHILRHWMPLFLGAMDRHTIRLEIGPPLKPVTCADDRHRHVAQTTWPIFRHDPQHPHMANKLRRDSHLPTQQPYPAAHRGEYPPTPASTFVHPVPEPCRTWQAAWAILHGANCRKAHAYPHHNLARQGFGARHPSQDPYPPTPPEPRHQSGRGDQPSTPRAIADLRD